MTLTQQGVRPAVPMPREQRSDEREKEHAEGLVEQGALLVASSRRSPSRRRRRARSDAPGVRLESSAWTFCRAPMVSCDIGAKGTDRTTIDVHHRLIVLMR